MIHADSRVAGTVRRLLLIIIPLLVFTAPALPAEDDAAVSLLRDLQQHLHGLTDFRAAFTQRLHTPHAASVREESGVLYVKMPGRMRWNYLEPERKEFICDGRRIWFYEPEEQAVTIYGAGAMTDSGTPLQLLLGQGDLFSDFLVSADDSTVRPLSPDGVMALLRPREDDSPFVRAHLEMTATPVPRLVRLIVVDPLQNATEYLFSDFRENNGLADDYFSFEPPPGTEIWEENVPPANSN